MKKTLSLLAMTAVLTSLAAFGTAQTPGPRGGQGGPGGGAGLRGAPGQGGGMMQGMMRRAQETQQKVLAQLNLSAKQKKEIAALDKKRDEDRHKLMEKASKSGNPDWRALRPEMQKLQENYRDGMQKILSKEQFKKYTDLMKAEREKMRQGREGRGPGGGRPGGGAGAPGGGANKGGN